MLISAIRQLIRRPDGKRSGRAVHFGETGIPGVRRRLYASYEEYLEHQKQKLQRRRDPIEQSDREYEEIVRERYGKIGGFVGQRVLCLGARLGGEVRAFKSLGALAIGIDLEPGEKNEHVLYGDFHDIKFPDGCFDRIFTNAVDHVYELDRFLRDVDRLLAPGGLLYAEMAQIRPGRYEVLDTSDLRPIIAKGQEHFDLVFEREIRNVTHYVDWSGRLVCFRKRR